MANNNARRGFAALALYALASCGPAPAEGDQDQPVMNTTAQPSAAALDARPSFPIDEVDARDLIDSLGAPWREPVADDTRADSFSGGYVRQMAFKGRSVGIYTLANAKVWNLQVRSGYGEQCGSGDDIAPHIARIYQAVRPGQSLDATQLATLQRGLTIEAGERLDLEGVRIKTFGTCIKLLDVRVGSDAE
ncbi:MAG: hypothetical protein CVT77_06400 [Alphaproteobacteria bacterium HGW-Alphaproteobacteria-16]|nr:MAG: hypothetical protein CVT77_06400 [Alphaproteobacteria bacterium HGW-Alphaproteobacteria-16]